MQQEDTQRWQDWRDKCRKWEEHLRWLGSRPVDPSVLCLNEVVKAWAKKELPAGSEVAYVPFNGEIAVHIRDEYDFECKRCRGGGLVNEKGNFSPKNTDRNRYVCQQCNGEGVRHHKDYCIHIKVPDHLWATYRPDYGDGFTHYGYNPPPDTTPDPVPPPEDSILTMDFGFGEMQ